MGSISTERYFECDAGELLRTIRTIMTSVSTEETRYYLNGIFVECIAGAIRMTATNGHHLTTGPLPAENVGVAFIAIWSSADFKAVRKWLTGHAGRVSVTIGADDTELRHSDDRAIIRHVDGTYVDYQRVMPRDRELSAPVAFNRVAARKAIAAMTLHGPMPHRGADGNMYRDVISPSVRFSAGNNELVLTVKNTVEQIEERKIGKVLTRGPRTGQTVYKKTWEVVASSDDTRSKTIPVVSVKRSAIPMTATYDAAYIIDLLSHGGALANIRINLTSGPSSIDCNDGLTRVIMPLRA